MRTLGEGAYARRISWLLTITLLLPFLVFAGAPRPARAQLSRVPPVAVLDFGNRTNEPGGVIRARSATDAVVVEMTRTGRFDVTPRTQLNTQLQESGLTPPLDLVGVRRLGQALGVDFVATGDITRVTVGGTPRRAQVTLSVRLIDVVSGELANGAIESGLSPEPPAGFQPDDDTLINQALTNAAFNAVQRINNYTLPEATILNTRGQTEVLLNRGSRDGITSGLEMIVIRGSERVGRIRVSTVNSTDSTASITDTGKGIRPEDRARAIFALPGVEVNTTTGQIRTYDVPTQSFGRGQRRPRSVFTTILGLLAAVGVAALLFNPRGSGGGVNVQARAYAEPNGGPGSTGAETRVRVTFNATNGIPEANIVQFLVFRNTSTVPFGDNVDTVSGELPIAVLPPGARSFDDTPLLGRTITYNVVTPGGELEEQTSDAPPFTPGVPQRYRVDVIYQRVQVTQGGQQGGGGGNQDGVVYVQSRLSNFSGLATPVPRPQIVQPSSGQQLDLRNVSFSFQGSRGANQYVVEVADNSAFRNKKRPTSSTQGNPFTSLGTGRITVGPFNLTNSGFTAREGLQLFFRVGARNSNDNPGPLKSETDPNGDAFIYSDTGSFNVIGNPPSPPGVPGAPGTGTGGPPAPPTSG